MSIKFTLYSNKRLKKHCSRKHYTEFRQFYGFEGFWVDLLSKSHKHSKCSTPLTESEYSVYLSMRFYSRDNNSSNFFGSSVRFELIIWILVLFFLCIALRQISHQLILLIDFFKYTVNE